MLFDLQYSKDDTQDTIGRKYRTQRERKNRKSRKVDREADLPAEARARDVFTSEHAEAKGQPLANDILTPGHGLNLRFSQVSVFGVSSEDLGTKRERGAKIVQQ
jgi:hypothetical protein